MAGQTFTEAEAAPNGAAPAAPRMLTREDILLQPPLPVEIVAVPEWGGQVRVQGLTGKGRDEYFASLATIKGGQRVGVDTTNATAKLVARCLVGEDGQPLFTQMDVRKLGDLSAAALDRVFAAAQRLSGMEEGQLEELGEDSAATPDGGSSSS